MGTRELVLMAFLGGIGAPSATAQTGTLSFANRRPQATRSELEANAAEADRIAASPGYSSRLRAAKRAEAEIVRGRLVEGDFQTGDEIQIVLMGEKGLDSNYTVTASRSILIPNVGEIPLKGVLRSEVQDHLNRELRRYFQNPNVVAKALIRLSVFGQIGKPGFHPLPADMLLSSAIMYAGGPTGGTDVNRSQIKRGATVLWNKDQVRQALIQGATLDQLNLRAGDEIVVGEKKTSTINQVFFVAGGASAIVFLLDRLHVW
jgi:protein involved in polysaccharide export with SLBB domain